MKSTLRRSAAVARTAVLLFSVLLLGTGCAGSGIDEDATAQQPALASSAAGDDTEGESPAADEEGTPGVYAFGKTVTFDDGSRLTVSTPTKYRRGQFDFGGEDFPADVKFKVTFRNASKEVADLALTSSTLSSGETDGEEIFAEGTGSPTAKLLPGKSRSWTVAYGVDNPKQVTLTMSVGFLDYEDVTFTNEQ